MDGRLNYHEEKKEGLDLSVSGSMFDPETTMTRPPPTTTSQHETTFIFPPDVSILHPLAGDVPTSKRDDSQ